MAHLHTFEQTTRDWRYGQDGSRRSMCGPCKAGFEKVLLLADEVDGFGVVGRSAPGTYGPEPGSVVEASRLTPKRYTKCVTSGLDRSWSASGGRGFSQCDWQQLEAAKPCIDPSKCPKALPDRGHRTSEHCQALAALPPTKGDAPVAQSDLTRMGLNVTADAPKYFAAAVSPPYGQEALLKRCASVLFQAP